MTSAALREKHTPPIKPQDCSPGPSAAASLASCSEDAICSGLWQSSLSKWGHIPRKPQGMFLETTVGAELLVSLQDSRVLAAHSFL